MRDGDIDPGEIFVIEDLTGQIGETGAGIEGELEDMGRVLGDERFPETEIGRHCDEPFGCPMKPVCWAHLPEHSVFDLYRGGNRSWDLYGSGVHALADIPDRQVIQVACARTGEPHVDAGVIRGFLDGLNYPLSYLDFESMNPAVPMFDGTRPYQQICFQFSLHVQEEPGAEPRHVGWRADGADDPRTGFLEALRDALPGDGDNVGFEKARLNELAEASPGHADWIRATVDRFVDFMAPFRDFAYYHPDQKGSCSLPGITGRLRPSSPPVEASPSARFPHRTSNASDNRPRSPCRTCPVGRLCITIPRLGHP